MFGDIQQSGTVNRLMSPIAVIGSRQAFIHLCEHCEVDPHGNDIFVLLQHPREVVRGARYCRVIEIDGADDVPYRLRLLSDAHAAIRN